MAKTAEFLARELMQRFERFVLLHPRKRSEPPYRLKPQDTEWYAYAPGVAERLGLITPPENSPETVEDTFAS